MQEAGRVRLDPALGRHVVRGASPAIADRVAGLNAKYKHHSATDVLGHSLNDAAVGRAALVSSFGAESVVLLHMVSVVDRNTPVVFIDTHMLFEETVSYQRELADKLGLTDIRRIKPNVHHLHSEDPDDTLHRFDTDACCDLRKTRPLESALSGFDAWITGRKRFQSGTRAALEFFEVENENRMKINPLAHWTPEDVQDYMLNNRLPRHPLVAKGYPSIGCAPCTTPVSAGEDPRAGRWRNTQKEECGIHFVNGRIVRGPLPERKAS